MLWHHDHAAVYKGPASRDHGSRRRPRGLYQYNARPYDHPTLGQRHRAGWHRLLGPRTAPDATPSSSTAASPQFTFAGTGTHSVSLTVTTNGGCQTSQTFTDVIKIGTPVPASITTDPAPLPPDNTFCGRDSITFSDPASPAGEFVWHWDFGDGNIVNTNQPSIKHSYFSVAKKIVKLDLIHNGCPQSAELDIRINPPIVLWTNTADCVHGNPYLVTFKDTSQEYETDPFSAVWNFGDGNTQSLTRPNNQTVVHPYTPPSPPGLKSFDVTLTVSQGFCVQHLTKTITLGNVSFSFSVPSPQCSGVPISLTAMSPNPELITGYYWHWDYDKDLPYVFSPSNTAKIQSVRRGTHDLWLVIQLASGCTDSIFHPVQITYPDASFTMPAGSCINSNVLFTDKSTSDLATGSPVSFWAWDFGDSSKPDNNNQNPTHQFKDTGLYTVTLLIKDANGCARTFTSPTPIHITGPIAGFIGPDSFYCPKTPLIFKDTSIGYNLTDQRTYGDGSPDDATGIHPYAANGTYNVTLTVTDGYSCVNTTTKSIRIQNPIAAFDIADTTAICAPLQTQFTAHGQYYDSLYWDFGDGSTSTLPVTSHFYNTLDTFYAKLFVRGPGGCLDSATRRVLLLDPNKTSRLNYGPDLSKCDSVPIQFNLTVPGYTKFTPHFRRQYLGFFAEPHTLPHVPKSKRLYPNARADRRNRLYCQYRNLHRPNQGPGIGSLCQPRPPRILRQRHGRLHRLYHHQRRYRQRDPRLRRRNLAADAQLGRRRFQYRTFL
ncbi:PKD domain-containing protein [Puia sp. P3]|uniref:PKD domain-containing protein n=1 Tax=Puia sp. P3 TaxID=3423952 RepID=UPI003D66A5C3